MARKPSLTLIGPGRLGQALARALRLAGYTVPEIIARSSSGSQRRAHVLAKSAQARVATLPGAKFDADCIWICVPDREIAGVAREMAERGSWRGKFVFHASGALTSDELDVLRRCGARVASVHPLMTFVAKSIPPLSGVPFGIEGDRPAVTLARRVVRNLGGIPFPVRREKKAAYHAWGAFASPLLLATLVTAEQVAQQAGIPAREARKKVLPIVRQTLANYARLGPAGAFSGPIVRGDDETVRRHLQVLPAEARHVYTALAHAALRYLPSRNQAALRRALTLRG
jgi:predicted short-subunit dehydrogenase-like oxidoreductase (DUF2520 family)